MSALQDEVREWLQKANQDLLSAQILLNHRPPVLETACFHCQQAVEKLLKAYLTSQGVRFERVHNLVYLLDLCEEKHAELAGLREAVENLLPYAVEVRYPGASLALSEQDGQDALSAAEKIWGEMIPMFQNEIP